MDRTWEYARLATEVRRCFEKLEQVDARLLEMKRGHLAAKVFDLEAKLLDLHCELVDAAREPLTPAPRHERPDCGQKRLFEDDVPF